jgi:hypothetical protein
MHMAVVSLSAFATQAGRTADHMAASVEAVGHLNRMGIPTFLLQPLAGGDIGTRAIVANHANNAAYAAATQRLAADEQWQEFLARAMAGGSAQQVESSLLDDLDPNYQPAADRPLGVLLGFQWRAKDGRLAQFLGKVAEAVPHIERLGGAVRTMQCLTGRYPMTVMVSTAFADLDSYGAYADRTAADAEWQAFWADALGDPTADLVRTGLYLNVTA